MSRMKEQYQEQMNRICETNTLTAEDILEASYRKVIPFEHRVVKRATWKAVAAAIACVVTVSVSAVGAGAAGYGPLASLFLKAADPTTADLAEKGYLYEMNETKEKDGYQATLLGIAGDRDNPMIMMKLYIPDDEFVEKYDNIYITMYEGIEKNRYETNRIDLYLDRGEENVLGSYGFGEVSAKRDEDDHHVYYFSARGLMLEGEPSIVSVRSIRYYTEGSEWFEEIRLDIEFEVTLPIASMKETEHIYFDEGVGFTADNGINYEVVYVEMNEYNASVCVHIDDELYGHDASEDEKMQKEWAEIEKDLRFVVDGEEYHVAQPGYFFCHHMGDVGVDGISVVNPEYRAIPYATAEHIDLMYRDQLVANIK